jgi:hypothetical protein
MRTQTDGFWEGRQMVQRLQPSRSQNDERLWLSMLVDTMEAVSHPEVCKPSALAGLRVQLAWPISSPYLSTASFFNRLPN